MIGVEIRKLFGPLQPPSPEPGCWDFQSERRHVLIQGHLSAMLFPLCRAPSPASDSTCVFPQWVRLVFIWNCQFTKKPPFIFFFFNNNNLEPISKEYDTTWSPNSPLGPARRLVEDPFQALNFATIRRIATHSHQSDCKPRGSHGNPCSSPLEMSANSWAFLSFATSR